MLASHPYLHFKGNTEQAMNFYRSVFGGTFTQFQRFGDFPGGEKMRPEEKDKLIHVSLDIGNGVVIMATDALESMERKVEFGSNYHICLQAESEAEADEVFALLSEGGYVEMPLNKTFWGAYFGMCRDQFGVQWMINYSYPKNQ